MTLTHEEMPPMRAEQTSTEILRSLFPGASVGLCWGDFSCSHYRQRGRLYAASNAIAFFSNLFGFERRICLQLDDVTDIKAIRTTSVQITTVEGEQYIFKSFANRELVVLLLLQLKQEHTNGTRLRSYSDQSLDERLNILETSVDSLPEQSTEEDSNRQRVKPLLTLDTLSSTLPQRGPQDSDSEPEGAESVTTEDAISTSPSRKPTPDIPPEFPPVDSPKVDPQELWENTKDANDPPYHETSIDVRQKMRLCYR